MRRKIYIWIPRSDYRSRLIGPSGQNISTLEYITGTDIQVREDSWVIVHENLNSDIDMAKQILRSVLQDGVINPLRIIKLADEYKRQKYGLGLFDYLKEAKDA